jgi:hypothetical protein
MGDEGIERTPLTAPKTAISDIASAKSGAPPDASLSKIIEVWPKLSTDTRAAILRIVEVR